MTVEKRLQMYVLSRYRSIREFTRAIDMPYSTFATILSRGVDASSVTNIIRVCKGLGISVDALANGEIVPVGSDPVHPWPEKTGPEVDLFVFFAELEKELLNKEKVTAHGRELTREELDYIVGVLDITLEVVLKKLSNTRKCHNKNITKT